MVIVDSKLKYKDLYLFIILALIEQANQESVSVEIDQNNNLGPAYDLFFPDGLSLFGVGNRPTFIQIKTKLYTRHFYNYGSFYNHKDAYVAIISPFENESYHERWNNSYGFFGASFINRLRLEHPAAYINAVLINKESVLQTIDREPASLYRDRFEREIKKEDTFALKLHDDEIIITEETLKRVFENNELLFKLNLGSVSDTTRAALILGNGVSIPFGADSWSNMIDNMISY